MAKRKTPGFVCLFLSLQEGDSQICKFCESYNGCEKCTVLCTTAVYTCTVGVIVRTVGVIVRTVGVMVCTVGVIPAVYICRCTVGVTAAYIRTVGVTAVYIHSGCNRTYSGCNCCVHTYSGCSCWPRRTMVERRHCQSTDQCLCQSSPAHQH